MQNIKETSIPGLLLIERPMTRDARGFFREVVRWDELNEVLKVTCPELVEGFRPVQWNHSLSQPGVIRALHAENWNKLFYPVTGKMFAAIVDIRLEQPTFGKVETFVIDEEEPKALFLSKGLANSLCVVGDKPLHYMYLVDAYYDGSDVRAVAWDDPDLAIDWPVKEPIISDRDRNNFRLRELFPEKFSQ